MFDGVVVANEILDFAKRRKKRCLMFKVDFAQAKDCVERDFLEKVLMAMGFGNKWLKWIKGGVFNSFLSVLVNGSTTEDFKVTRGLKQGDPLSLFLFSIVVEGLATMIRRVVRMNILSDFKLNDVDSFIMLQFANDTIFVCDGWWSNLWGLKSILRGFEMVFGLKINFLDLYHSNFLA